MANLATDIAGWAVVEDPPGTLTATRAGERTITCGGGDDTPDAVLRARISEAIEESDWIAATGGGQPSARGGAVAYDATIVVADDGDEGEE